MPYVKTEDKKLIYLPNLYCFIKFQTAVFDWCMECFGKTITHDVIERNHRFLEEALELVQTLDCTRDEAHALVDYVFDREKGNSGQEAGGVLITLAALCNANEIEMSDEAEKELKRIWNKIDVIREKQANKPKHSPLPE